VNPRILKVPKGWSKSHVGSEFIIENNFREPLSSEERKKMRGPYPYYGPTRAIDSLDHFRVEGKYALIGEDGDHFLKFNKQDMTQLVSGKFNVNNHAHLVKGNGSNTTEWFYEYFRSRALTPYLTRQGAGRYKLNKSALNELPILIPPRNEQEKIHLHISNWDKAISIVSELIEKKSILKKGLMQQLLSGTLRFPEYKDDWGKFKLREITERVTRKNNIHNTNVLTISAQMGLVSQQEYYNKSVASKDLSTYYLLKKGDFAYNKSYSTGYPYGAIKRLDSYDAGVTSSLYICFEVSSPKCDKDFFAHFFEAGMLNHGIYRIAQEGARNHGLLNMSIHDFFNIEITIPNLQEQQKIATTLNIVDKELQILNQKLDALKKQKKGLMQQLLTGKIRVKIKDVP